MSTEHSVRRQAPGAWTLPGSLRPRPVEDLSLYVHIPFCESRCRYCNFYFETGWSPRVLEQTLAGILEESRAFKPWLFPEAKAKIKTVYFGGGTPSVIPSALLDEFLRAFRSIWDLNDKTELLEEFAFEANPESVSEDLLKTLGRHGVNRLSLGVQTFDDEILRVLGRRARRADIHRALETIAQNRRAETWSGSLNIDLMVGLPGQTKAQLDLDLQLLAKADPDHVSVYTLTLEERTPLEALLKSGENKTLADEEAEELWFHADSFLEAHGFKNYEVSNYAKPGYESRHNQRYWSLKPYLGLGPGAVSTLPGLLLKNSELTAQVAWNPEVLRLTNPHTFAYSRAGRASWEHGVEVLEARDFLLEHFITGLRTEQGLNLASVEKLFSLPPAAFKDNLNDLFKIWESRGYLSAPWNAQKAGRFSLSKAGRLMLNSLLEELLEPLDKLIFLHDKKSTINWPA